MILCLKTLLVPIQIRTKVRKRHLALILTVSPFRIYSFYFSISLSVSRSLLNHYTTMRSWEPFFSFREIFARCLLGPRFFPLQKKQDEGVESLFATSFQLVTICHRVVSKVKSSRRAQPQREIKFPSRTLERRANILSEIQLHKITRPFSTISLLQQHFRQTPVVRIRGGILPGVLRAAQEAIKSPFFAISQGSDSYLAFL